MGTDQSKPQQSKGDGIPFVQWNDEFHFAEPSSYRYALNKEWVGVFLSLNQRKTQRLNF